LEDQISTPQGEHKQKTQVWWALTPEDHLIMDRFIDPSFSSCIENSMNKHHVPGLSIAMVKNNQVSSASYGCASFDPPVPCTAETLFDVASCAKSLTAASIALLVEDNEEYPEVQYDTLISSLLPEDFVMSGSGFTEGVTVEDLLSHRTGMAP
jgi:CubicO group peptidase (beta-lactamase class C family)